MIARWSRVRPRQSERSARRVPRRAAPPRVSSPFTAHTPPGGGPFARQRIKWIWTIAFALLSVWIVQRFIEPLAWAGLVAIVTWPAYRIFARRFAAGTASNAAAGAFTLLVALFVFAPLAFAFGAVLSEGTRFLAWMEAIDRGGLMAPAWVERLPMVGATVLEWWRAVLGAEGGLSRWLQRADASALLGWAQALARFMERQVFIGFFTVFALFFAYRGGEAFATVLGRAVAERLDPGAPRYLDLAARAVRATVGGMVVLALFDGVLTGLLYAAAGVPRPVVWGAVTGIAAMLPFVGYLAVAGVAVGVAAPGACVAALATALSGSLVLFLGDKVVRPLLVGGAAKLNLFWVLVGSLGGFQVLGLIGVFLGPVLLALCAELWREGLSEAGIGAGAAPTAPSSAGSDRAPPRR